MVKCQDQKVKFQQKDFIKGNIHVNYQSYSTHNTNVSNKVKVFKSRQTPRSRLQGQYWFLWNGSVTIITQVKYQCSSTHHSNIVYKFKVFKK